MLRRNSTTQQRGLTSLENFLLEASYEHLIKDESFHRTIRKKVKRPQNTHKLTKKTPKRNPATVKSPKWAFWWGLENLQSQPENWSSFGTKKQGYKTKTLIKMYTRKSKNRRLI